MSIAEFSAAMRNKALVDWINVEKGAGIASASAKEAYSLANVNLLVNSTKIYRTAEQTAAKTSFVITKDTVRSLLGTLKGLQGDLLEEQTDKIFSKFGSDNEGVKVRRRKIKVGDVPAVFFNSISFDSITNLVNNILDLSPGQLATEYEKGHVIGLATNLFKVTAERVGSIDARAAKGASPAKDILIAGLSNVVDYYKELDLASANIKPASEVAIYASSEKILTRKGGKYLVELQTKAANQLSADDVKATIGSIKKLFSPGNISDSARLALVDKILLSVKSPKFTNELLNIRSSPSLVDMIGIHVASTIEGKPNLVQKYTVPKTKIASKKVPKVDLSEVRKLAKEETRKLTDLISKLKIKATEVTVATPTASLEALLRSRLTLQIEKNMGTGSATNVLNYRTGRFAESATIDHLSTSRAGMISVFYNYMKYPYATFSKGGAQQSPRTRDPKTLISKSIREIGAALVGNRMRAVLV